jgi:hypothetical protein
MPFKSRRHQNFPLKIFSFCFWVILKTKVSSSVTILRTKRLDSSIFLHVKSEQIYFVLIIYTEFAVPFGNILHIHIFDQNLFLCDKNLKMAKHMWLSLPVHKK